MFLDSATSDKGKLLIGLVLVFSLLLGLFLVQPVTAGSEKLKILEHKLVREDVGTSYETVSVEGRAKNVSGKEISYAEIMVVFQDKDGVRIDSFLANTNDLADQEVWAFEVMATGLMGEEAAEVADYRISVETINIPEGGGCFIATAAYGTKRDKRLRPLRNLRDDVLLTNDFGKTIVNAYYDTSPPIADAMRNNDLVRSAAKYSMVIPASTTAGILMNGMGLLLALIGVIGLLLLSYSYGKLTAVLKVISASILTPALGTVLILSLGWASYLWAGFATIAAYILPLVFPAVIVTSTWVLKRNL